VSDALAKVWKWHGGALPGHVVCSSLADILYQRVGWAHPAAGTERFCMPADWWAWNNNQGWEAP
jgi:hypothetical protein